MVAFTAAFDPKARELVPFTFRSLPKAIAVPSPILSLPNSIEFCFAKLFVPNAYGVPPRLYPSIVLSLPYAKPP